MKTLLRLVSIALAVLGAIIGFITVGFRVKPTAPRLMGTGAVAGTVEIPAHLPDPVRRYLKASVGEQVPLVRSMVMSGDASIRRGALWMPVRYWVAHLPGYHFRRQMEITWYGIPVVKGVDQFIKGRGTTTVAGERLSGPHVDQAANLMLWAEGVLMPSLFITDPRVRWEAIDDDAARLLVPFADGEDSLTLHFAPDTGLIRCMTALRYKDDGDKQPWRVEFLEWSAMNGGIFPKHFAVTWAEEGRAWSYWHVNTLVWNGDLAPYLADVEPPGLATNLSAPASTSTSERTMTRTWEHDLLNRR